MVNIVLFSTNQIADILYEAIIQYNAMHKPEHITFC